MLILRSKGLLVILLILLVTEIILIGSDVYIQSPSDKWIVSQEPTLLIWNKADLTQKNLESEEIPCGIGFATNIGEIYEGYNYIYVTMDGIIDYVNVDSTVIGLFEKYGYKDQQQANAFDVWTIVSYKAVQNDSYVYIKRLRR